MRYATLPALFAASLLCAAGLPAARPPNILLIVSDDQGYRDLGADGNHTRPVWVEMHGLVDGSPAGIVVLSAPSNFRHPQPVRLHPSKPYFCFAPNVVGDFTIEPGRPYVSRYRLAVHDGPPDAQANDRLYADYAAPPEARLVD